MASIFDRIFRYRQSEGRTPREDYFTELFASILERYDFLGTVIVGRLLNRNDIETVRIQTQKSFDGPRVDMYVTAWAENERHVLVIESKIDSPRRPGQLETYIDLLAVEDEDADAGSRTLAYVTKSSDYTDVQALEDRQDNVEFTHLKWHRVYDWIKEFVEEGDGADLPCKEFLNEFLILMEDWNMGGPISARSMRAAIVWHNCLDSGKRLLDDITAPAWNDSGMGEVFANMETNGKWYTYLVDVWRYSSKLTEYGDAQIGMGFQFDRRDEVWNVDEMELPSAAVVVYGPDAADFPPPKGWEKGPVLGWDPPYIWVRQIEDHPQYGESLEEFYLKFFRKAFKELHRVLTRG